jgi:hypothetical protein
LLAGLVSFLVFSVAAAAEVRFEVGGAVESADEALEVRVDVFNAGDVAATAVDVRGEFADEADVVTLPEGIPAGATRSALFRFAHVPRAGVHVLGLRLDYTEAAAAGRVAVTTSQRAYLLLSLGANPPPALRVSVADVTVATQGTVAVRVESADGRPHRARVRVLTPRGLNANDAVEIAVPATGGATAAVPLLRGTVARPSRQGILAVAEIVGEEVAQASVATGLVSVEADPALLPKLRPWLVGLVIALVLAAAFLEIRARPVVRSSS